MKALTERERLIGQIFFNAAFGLGVRIGQGCPGIDPKWIAEQDTSTPFAEICRIATEILEDYDAEKAAKAGRAEA